MFQCKFRPVQHFLKYILGCPPFCEDVEDPVCCSIYMGFFFWEYMSFPNVCFSEMYACQNPLWIVTILRPGYCEDGLNRAQGQFNKSWAYGAKHKARLLTSILGQNNLGLVRGIFGAIQKHLSYPLTTLHYQEDNLQWV